MTSSPQLQSGEHLCVDAPDDADLDRLVHRIAPGEHLARTTAFRSSSTADVGTASTSFFAPVTIEMLALDPEKRLFAEAGSSDHDGVGVARITRLHRSDLGHRAVDGARRCRPRSRPRPRPP